MENNGSCIENQRDAQIDKCHSVPVIKSHFRFNWRLWVKMKWKKLPVEQSQQKLHSLQLFEFPETIVLLLIRQCICPFKSMIRTNLELRSFIYWFCQEDGLRNLKERSASRCLRRERDGAFSCDIWTFSEKEFWALEPVAVHRIFLAVLSIEFWPIKQEEEKGGDFLSLHSSLERLLRNK